MTGTFVQPLENERFRIGGDYRLIAESLFLGWSEGWAGIAEDDSPGLLASDFNW